MEKEVIINRLKAVFASVKKPSTVSDGCPRKICREIERRFGNKTRENLNKNDILFMSAELTLLNENAFHYFLPVILEAALEDINSVSFDHLVQNLFHYSGERDFKKFQDKRLKIFSTAQSDVILDIIEWWINNEDIGESWRESLVKSLPFWRKRAKR
ncbi:MAG: DUF6714 family protein [Candidatus Hodarchaeota archaeon]